MRLAQVNRADYVFCQQCPMATVKTLYLVIGADSDDAAARALARIRDALRQRGTSRPRLEQLAAEQGAGDAAKSRWVMYAVVGKPDEPELTEQIRELVKKHPRSSYRIFAPDDARAEMGALAKVLGTAGVSSARLGKNVLQREHVPDEILGRSGNTPKSADGTQRLLVIEPAER